MKYFLHILIPSYGSSPFLKETICSAIAATNFSSCKITVVDDSSPTDDIKDLVQNHFTQVEYVRNGVNLGVGGNFNRCIQLSEGTLTLIIGSDDRLLPNYLNELIEIHSINSRAALYQLGVTVINENSQSSNTFTDFIKSKIKPNTNDGLSIPGTKILESLLIGNWSYFPAIVWNTEIIRNYEWETKYQLAVDLDMLLKLAIADENFCLMDGVQFEYRRHSTNVSKLMIASGDRIDEELEVYSKIFKSSKLFKNPKTKLLSILALTARLNALISGFSLLTQSPSKGFGLIAKSLSFRNYVLRKL